MARRGLLRLAGRCEVRCILLACAAGVAAVAAEPAARTTSAELPRKVIVGTVLQPFWVKYPGLDKRLEQLAGIIDRLAEEAKNKYGRGLDLAILPEMAVTGEVHGDIVAGSFPLAGPVEETFARKAREHHCYIVVPLYLLEDKEKRLVSNAGVLIGRNGEVVGTYRKIHPAVGDGSDSFEGGVTPGKEAPVFQCDFGRLGIQICYDINFDYGWKELARQGADLVAWPTQSPQTAQPAFRAMEGRYYVVSSTWRNNASVFEPTGRIIAQIKEPRQVLVQEIDLSYALLPWSSKLAKGVALGRIYGPRVGFRYYEDEDLGMFWSNDPQLPIGDMLQTIGVTEHEAELARVEQLFRKAGVPGAPARAADTYLPWEGGPACYRKWSNGISASSDFFPVSVWLQDPKHAPEYKAIGINQFVGLWRGPTEEQLAALAEAGIPVLAAQRKSALDGAHSAMIRGWTLMDEPDNAQSKPGGGYGPCILPVAIEDQYRHLRELDATRPVYLNLGQGVANDNYRGRGQVCGRHMEHYAAYIRGADIVSYDVYPVNSNYPLWWVGEGVSRLRKWADYKKPVWDWIEASAIRGGARPSPAQIRAEVWMSILHGAMGVGYFCHEFKPREDDAAPLHDPATRQALAAINSEIASLARALNSPPVANGVAVTSSNPESPIDFLLKREGADTYLFAMGARPGGETLATFKLRDCGHLTATVIGESRTVEVTAGVLEDRFDDYQVHLYKLPFNPARSGR